MAQGPWRRSTRSRSSPQERQADAIAAMVSRADSKPSSAHRSRQGLPAVLAGRLRSATGYDFSGIRVHAGSQSASEARRLGARAFTVGRNVHLGSEAATDQETLLAHEAVHAAQQGSVPQATAWGGPSTTLLRSEPNIPQLTPGVDATDSWRDLVRQEAFIPDEPTLRARGTSARDRFLQAREGQRLINNLWQASNRGRASPRFGLGVAFRTQLPPQTDGLDASGYFEPNSPSAGRYTVHVKDVLPPISGSFRVGGITGEGVGYAHTDPESDMAATLHHELEHVEFVRTGAGTIWPTGHGDVSKGEVEPAFRERIAAFQGDLDAIERRIRADAVARNQEPIAAAPATRDVAPARSASTPSDQPFVGFRLSGEAGLAGQDGRRFAGVAGADLVLGRISSLNLGARGVYLTPDRLFAGGAVGIRFGQSAGDRAGQRVENPLFFDIEAGVVGQLNATEASRVMDRVGLFGSAGVGQEYGTSGNRFFWRLGGFVIVSDRGNASGGGTAGIGVRFQ